MSYSPTFAHRLQVTKSRAVLSFVQRLSRKAAQARFSNVTCARNTGWAKADGSTNWKGDRTTYVETPRQSILPPLTTLFLNKAFMETPPFQYILYHYITL